MNARADRTPGVVFNGEDIVRWCNAVGVTHFIWLPDSELGQWEAALLKAEPLKLVRVCREGEAMGIAAGLLIGGQKPVVAIQSTGFFEAGDAFRNVVHDLGLPLFLLIGYRSYFAYREGKRRDSAARFIEPILKAWELPYKLFLPGSTVDDLCSFFRKTYEAGQAAAALIAESRL